MYFRWRRLLPAWIEVVPLELPGRGSRIAEPAVREFDALATRLVESLASGRHGSGPYALFGHSMGALLAHGIARRLHAQGAPLPQALLVSAAAAPSRRAGEHFPAAGDSAALTAELRRHGGTPDELFSNPELLRMTLDLLDADYRVCESYRYRPAPPLPLPIHVFAGREDDIDEPCLRAWWDESGRESTLDWFHGGHFYLRESESALLHRIAACLRRARVSPPDSTVCA